MVKLKPFLNLKNRRVQSLFADSLNHTMLVATDGGLGILHEDYCVDFITKRDGLSSNNLEDAKLPNPEIFG